MKTRILILIITGLCYCTCTFSQMSKAEKKELGKKLKEFKKDPQSLKDLVESKSAAEKKVAELTTKKGQLETELTDKNAEIVEMELSVKQLQTNLDTLRIAYTKSQNTDNVGARSNQSMDYSKGIIFRVQIGAFKNKNLSKYFENNPNFGGEASDSDSSEPQRITIGIFRDYWQADTFKKYMREMGVSDAWIVPYQDGNRVAIKSVLSSIPSQK